MPIKIFGKEHASFSDHVIARVKIPEDLNKSLSVQQKSLLKHVCMKEYIDSKKCLNESIADVATHDEKALAFASELAKRVLLLIEVAADLNLDTRVKKEVVDESQLKQLGVSEQQIRARSPDLTRELKRGRLKREVLGEIKGDLGAMMGYVGMSPLAIKNAAEGNLRERMLIPYLTTFKFTGQLFSDQANIRLINSELARKHISWRVNEEVINELKTHLGDRPLYEHGSYSANRESIRVSRSEVFTENYVNQNPTVEEMKTKRIPLSKREVLVQTGDIHDQSTKKIRWRPGEALFGMEENTNNPTVTAAREAHDVMLTGISGTTDAILTIGYFLGMFDGEHREEKMRDGLVACIGWLVDTKNHSAHEVQTSAKSFGLYYRPGPDSYKQIRPGDSRFEAQLRDAQLKRGHLMPDDVLTESHIRDTSRALFTTTSKEQTPIRSALLKELLAKLKEDKPKPLQNEPTSDSKKL